MSHKRSLLGGCLSVLSNKFLGYKKGFSITEVLIALGVIAVIAVLILPVITTRAQNKSFALSYDTEVKQMLNSLEGLPVSENKEDISNTMMYVESDTGSYANNAGAYINKYMKVVKYCGDEPGDCFGGQYYEYKDNDRVEFDIKDIKGACALLKNGVSICLKPQIKNASGTEEIQGWIDLNGPKGPNIYGRDLRTFAINLKQKAVFTEEEPTRVIVPDPPAPCEGEDCGEIEKDPCKVNPRGEECCKREGFVASGKDDICCPWYRDASTGPNHLKCYPGTVECDPATDPNCKIDECSNHAITGPGDECCAVIEAQGKHDPNCCAPNDTSDYCCSVHPETEGCCRKNIQSGKLKLTADSNCCTKYPSIYAEFSACKPACEQNNNSEQCCNTVSRRNEIREPDDACCMYEAVNGLDAQGENNAYNKYCCRLPKNNSDQCCKWKYEHINSSLDYYTKHDYNVNGGTFDGCCHGNIRGIKYTENKTDAKSIAVLNRCCTVNQAQSDTKEDELCCDYLVGQLGAAKLQHGQALRRCCKYDKHKNKPQCCSHDHDGMASQTYNANVPWASQCCMPNSIYNNNVDPHIQCCFAVPNALGESNAFWNNKRWEGCCSYGDNTYNGHKANAESQWQKNCCKLSRSKYPSDATYNAACCNADAAAKGANRDSWQYFSATKNECCETLDNQYNKSRDDHWQSHCCYGFKGGNLATNNPYYETESKCCKITGNWTEGCCTKSGLDTNDEKWKKNCCSLPTQYSSNVEYRKYCCFDSNTSNQKAKNTDTDYTRNSDNADNPNSKNAANVNNGNNRQYCCDPDMADNPSITDNNNKFTWGSSNTPKKECCDYFAGRDWKNNDGGALSKYYKAACCQAYGHKDGLNCEELWMCGARYGYGVTPSKLSAEIANGCCINWSLIKANEDIPTSAWKNGCCDNPAYYQSNVSGKNAAYRQFCCAGASSDRQRRGEGNTSANAEYCCFPDSTNPNVECCKMFRSKGNSNVWKDWDGNTLSNDYMTYCCNKSTSAGQNTANNYCPDSCAIRWNTAESTANINYDFSRCCTDRALATNKSVVNSSTAVNRTKAIWKNNCCAYSPVNPAGNNIAGYASFVDYRSGCCNASQDQTFKSGNGGSSQNNINCCIPNQTTVNTSTGAVSGIAPTAACCDAFNAHATTKSGDGTQDWKDHDGNSINEAYKLACCILRDKCYDSCPIRWRTGLAASDVKSGHSSAGNNGKYNFSACCKRLANSNDTKYGKTKDFWKAHCCRYAGIRTSDGYASYADYRSGCCKPNTEQTFKDTNDGANQNNINCCIPNQVSVNTSTGAVSGIAPSKACCEAFKAYDTSKTGAWKSHDGETINDAYKTACCKLHGVCPDGPDACRIRSNTWNTSMYNLPACCTDSTMQSQHYKDSDQVWRKACCDGGTTGKSTLNTLGDADYRNYCCSNAGSSDATLKSGTQDRRCCKNAGNTTRLRNQYCCSHDVSSRSDLTNIGYHCDCTTAANTWQVVNTAYQTTCCTDSNVMTSATSSITNNTTTRADWQSKCCTQSIVHTSPANNTIRDRHYSYCCNNGGAYANKSTWLNSTCCKVTSSSSASKSTEGVDWNGVTTVSACCYYLESYPTETCCSAKQSSAGWNNTTSTRDTGYKKSCCDQVNNDKYCSCGSKLDKNMSTSDACCNAMKSSDNTKARWQADCCKYRTSYPSNAAYRSSTAGCCSGDGVNATKNPASQNDVKYCCDPNISTPTAACCNAYKANGWKNWEGPSISDAYRIYCCKQHDVCDGPTPDDDNCRIRSLTDTPARYNLPTCCNKGGMQARHKNDSTWQANCCDGSTTGSSSRNTLSTSDFQTYCCSGSSHATKMSGQSDKRCCTKGGNWTTDYCCSAMGSSLKDTHCTCANAATTYNYVKGTGCCGDSTVVNRVVNTGGDTRTDWKSKCCTLANKGANSTTANWVTAAQFKSYCCNPASGNNTGAVSPSGTSYGICCDTYNYGKGCCKSSGVKWDGTNLAACCNGSDTAPTQYCCNQGKYGAKNITHCCATYKTAELCNTCALRATYMSQLHNTTTCCYDSTVYSRLSSDTTLRSSWISSCCSNATVKGTSYYKTYCCKGTYTGQATNGSSTWDDTSNCCNVSSVANAKCCGATSTWLGTKCCKGTDASTNGTDYSSSANASKCCNYNGAATTTCCDAASSGGWTSAYGGGGYLGSEGNPKSFREKCCVLNAKYCDCKMKWEFRWNDFKSNTSCCSDLKNKSNYSGSSFVQLSGYRDVCCTGTNPGGLDKSTFQTYCCKNDYGKVRNGDDNAWCCTGSTTTSSNHDWCCKQGYKSQCRCLDNYGNAYNGNQRTECCNNSAKHDDNSAWCCSKGYNQCTCKQKWVSSCCSEGNIGYSSGNDRKACCASLYGTSGEGNLFAGAGSTCCQALGTGDNGYSSYNGKTYDKCKAPCYKSSTYSTSKLSSYKYTTNSAAYCCNYNYGLVSGGSSNSTWKSYCCKTYYSGSWNFLNSSDSYGCCNSLYSNNVYWYDPAYYGGSCSGLGGTANKCSDYKYTSAGFYCGSPNQCKAWRFQGGSQPTLSSCCSSLYSWGYLDGSYKTTCCGDSTFRKSSTGQSVCCSSEPSDSTLKSNCCSDNSSRSYCCGSSSSPNYYKFSCCYARLGSKCANYASGKGSLTDAEKKDCCKCCKGDPTWGNSFNGGFCNNSSYCLDCGSGPSSSKISEACCKEWEDAGVLTSDKTIANKCCADYSGFYHYKYNGSSVYCKQTCSSTNCKGTLTWNVSCSRHPGYSQYEAKWTTNSNSNMCIGHNLLYIDIWPGQCLSYGGQPPLQKKYSNGNGSCSASYTDWQRDNNNNSIACGCKVYFYVMNKTNSNGEWYWEKISESCSGSYSYNMNLGSSCTTTHK